MSRIGASGGKRPDDRPGTWSLTLFGPEAPRSRSPRSRGSPRCPYACTVAYGPEAIIVVLALAGAGALHLILPITGGDRSPVGHPGLLLPAGHRGLSGRGWGLCRVSRQFGLPRQPRSRRSSDRRLHLTVAVSIAAGVGALTSAFPSLTSATVPLCLAILAVIPLLNLRGLGETGRAFSSRRCCSSLLARHHRRRLVPPLALPCTSARSFATAYPRPPSRERASGAQGILLRRSALTGVRRSPRRPPLQATPCQTGQANRNVARCDPGRHAVGRYLLPVAGTSVHDRTRPFSARHGGVGRHWAYTCLHTKVGLEKLRTLTWTADPGQPAGPRQLSATPLLVARRSAGLRERHLGPCWLIRHGERRSGTRTNDPAVRQRGVHWVHPLANWVGRPLVADPSTSLAPPCSYQRGRCCHNCTDHDCVSDLEVCSRGLGRGGRRARVLLPLRSHQHLLQPGWH